MEDGVTVSALMTAPRYECVAARNRIEKAMRDTGIPLTISGGVYYGQCMQRMLEDLVEKDVQYALTVDFDSIFIAKHVHRLLSMIVHTEADAVAAVQPKRGHGTILASKGAATSIEWTGEPIEVHSAHFGLTVLDLRKLANVPKPWFFGQPQDDGTYGDKKIDDDVWFWNQWRKAGNSVYIDPGCRLGHLEELVTYYDQQMKLIHAYMPDWETVCETTAD